MERRGIFWGLSDFETLHNDELCDIIIIGSSIAVYCIIIINRTGMAVTFEEKKNNESNKIINNGCGREVV